MCLYYTSINYCLIFHFKPSLYSELKKISVFKSCLSVVNNSCTQGKQVIVLSFNYNSLAFRVMCIKDTTVIECPTEQRYIVPVFLVAQYNLNRQLLVFISIENSITVTKKTASAKSLAPKYSTYSSLKLNDKL